MDRQRAGNGTQQHSFNDVVVEFEARRLDLFGERHRQEIEVLRLQPAGGGVAPRIPIVKIGAARKVWRSIWVQYEFGRDRLAALVIVKHEPAPDKTCPRSSTLTTETLPAPVMMSPLE